MRTPILPHTAPLVRVTGKGVNRRTPQMPQALAAARAAAERRAPCQALLHAGTPSRRTTGRPPSARCWPPARMNIYPYPLWYPFCCPDHFFESCPGCLVQRGRVDMDQPDPSLPRFLPILSPRVRGVSPPSLIEYL